MARLGACMSPVGLTPSGRWRPVEDSAPTVCAPGTAIMWPSVLSADPFATDLRTQHEALPVVRGRKFAANFWMHMYDFQGPHARGCANDNYRQHAAMEGVARQYTEGKITPAHGL